MYIPHLLQSLSTFFNEHSILHLRFRMSSSISTSKWPAITVTIIRNHLVYPTDDNFECRLLFLNNSVRLSYINIRSETYGKIQNISDWIPVPHISKTSVYTSCDRARIKVSYCWPVLLKIWCVQIKE
jgi:hypothetical protein